MSGNFRQPVLVGRTRKYNESQSRQLVSQATYVSGPKETPLLQILAVREMLQELLKPVHLYQKNHFTCHWQKGQMATRDASHHSKVHVGLQAPSVSQLPTFSHLLPHPKLLQLMSVLPHSYPLLLITLLFWL